MNTLVVQYYNTDPVRQRELDHCLEQNVERYFDRVIICCDPRTILPKVAYTHTLHIERRLAFSDYLRLVSESDFDGITVLTNSDIILDKEIIYKCKDISIKELFAISRYEADGCLHQFHWCSQDTWILRNQKVPNSVINSCTFELGRPGCELRFAEVLWCVGFNIINPSLSVRNTHIHKNSSVHSDSERYYGAYIFTPSTTIDHSLVNLEEKRSSLVYLRQGSATAIIPST